MAVKTYSLKKDGNVKLSPNFSDTVKIDLDNVTVLQKSATTLAERSVMFDA